MNVQMLWNNSPPLDPILSQLNPFHIPLPCNFKIHSNGATHLRLGLPTSLFLCMGSYWIILCITYYFPCVPFSSSLIIIDESRTL
jgi:hypothetical protein